MQKCGQILLTSKRNFIISCICCDGSFVDYSGFRSHVLEEHLDPLSFNKFGSLTETESTEDSQLNYNNSVLSLEDETEELTKDEAGNIKYSWELVDPNTNDISFKECGQDNSFSGSENLNDPEFESTMNKNFGKSMEEDKICCTMCGKYYSLENFKKHKARRRCGYCPVCCIQFADLYKHIKGSHKNYYKNKKRLKEPIVDRIVKDKNPVIKEKNENLNIICQTINDESNSSQSNDTTNQMDVKHQSEESKEDIEIGSYNGNDEKVACSYCGEVFTVERFKKHRLQKSCGKCPVCSSIFANIFKHVQKHHMEYKAEKQRLNEKAIIRLPLFDVNNINHEYSCSYCERIFISKKYYNDHIKHHAEYPKICTFCDKSFKHSYNLTRHLRIHTNERPYKCEICSFGFNDDSNLRDHFINKHTEGLNIKCTFENCNKVFKTQAKRKYHEACVHTGRYAKSCKECGLTFITSGRLNEHTKKFHMKYEDRQFSCKYCGKKFAFKYELTPHEMAHLGLKPFKCRFCPKEYGTRKSLRGHCRIIHGKGPEEF